MGPGIPDSSPNPDGTPEQIFAGLQAGSQCPYRGTSIDTMLQIPAGAARMVQVLGMTTRSRVRLSFGMTPPELPAVLYAEGKPWHRIRL